MILLKDIKGQDNAVRYLNNSLISGRISDSYLFTGPGGVGRVLAAKAFIAELVCRRRSSGGACGECSSCRRVDSLEHPDIMRIKPEKNGTIKINEIRAVKDKLRLKPFEAPVNVCLIEEAHMMTAQAANALLKLLEEPPGESMLILVSDRKENILPTVLSRCTEVRFRSLSVNLCRDIIAEVSGVSLEEALMLAYFSQGSPGLALEMIEYEVLEKRKESMESLRNMLFSGTLSCACWGSDKKDDLAEAADMLVTVLRDIVIAREGCYDNMINPDIKGSEIYDFFEKYTDDRIYQTIDKLIRLKRAVLGSVNPKLADQIMPGCLEMDYL